MTLDVNVHHVTKVEFSPIRQIFVEGQRFSVRHLVITTTERDGREEQIQIGLFADFDALRIVGDPIPLPAEMPAPILQAAE